MVVSFLQVSAVWRGFATSKFFPDANKAYVCGTITRAKAAGTLNEYPPSESRLRWVSGSFDHLKETSEGWKPNSRNSKPGVAC